MLRSAHDREIIQLAIPALATLVAEPIYILTDTAIVGRIGTVELAGLAIASALLLTVASIATFLAYGTTAAVARLLGAGRPADAADQAVQGLWLALFLGVASALALWAASPSLVDLIGATDRTRPAALLYLRVSLVGLPAMLLSLAGVGYLRGLRDTRTPLGVALGTSVLNLVIEVVLIFGLGFGLGASALATVIAQWCGAAVFLRRIGKAVKLERISLSPRLGAIGALVRVGSHLVVRTVSLRASLLLGSAAAARTGEAEIAAYQISFEIWSLLALALDSLAIAAQALVGTHLGSGNIEIARAVGRRVTELSIAFGVLAAMFVLALRFPLASIFSDDSEVVALGAYSLVFVAISQPINGWVFALDGVLIGAGDQRYLAWAMAASAAVFAPLGILLLVATPGLGWLWAALLVFMGARLVALHGRFAGGAWAVTGAVRT